MQVPAWAIDPFPYQALRQTVLVWHATCMNTGQNPGSKAETGTWAGEPRQRNQATGTAEKDTGAADTVHCPFTHERKLLMQQIEETMTAIDRLAHTRDGAAPNRDGAERRRVEQVVETLATLRSPSESLAEVAHDARNMVTALGLYCDLLEEPGVLAAPFVHYGRELRLLAAASRRLVEKLVALDAQADPAANDLGSKRSDFRRTVERRERAAANAGDPGTNRKMAPANTEPESRGEQSCGPQAGIREECRPEPPLGSSARIPGRQPRCRAAGATAICSRRWPAHRSGSPWMPTAARGRCG